MGAAKKRIGPYPREFKDKAIARALELQAAAEAKGATGRNTGAIAETAREFKTSEANISAWVMKHKDRLGASSAKTLVSPQSAPMSGAVSVRGPLPPVPTVTLQGLEEYINAIVDRRIKERLAAMLGGG